MKIVILGPPQSGKSCLIHGLRDALARIPGCPRPYPIDTTPDGEGAWFRETSEKFPEKAAAFKSRKKRKFDWQWTELVSGWVRNCRLPLALVDTGGRLDVKLALIARWGTHAIVLSSDPAAIPEWEAFARCAGLDLLAVLHSKEPVAPDEIDATSAPLRGVIHGLLRGRDCSQNIAILELARRIAAHAPPANEQQASSRP